ncbi:coil containing protein [Caudoviricetes sp.]|nr:MAG: coil containing protein [Podoviridae sp. ct2cs2]UOF77506.1 coil containing protein [Caudoviricetes sp.]
MPKFEITAPDGRLFEVTAPEGASQAEVLAYAQKNFGQPPKTSIGQKALGVGEAALTAGTGVIGQFAGNIAGVGKELLTGDFGKGTAEKTAQQVQQALTYQPRGQVAPQILEGLQTAVEESKIAPTPITGAANIGFRTKAKVPSAADIKGQASNLYKQIDDAGVLIKTEPFNEFVNRVKVDIGSKVREARNPKIADAIKELDEATGSPKTLQKMQDLRESISRLKMSSEPSDRMFAGKIVEELDDFMEKLDTTKLVAPAKGDIEAIKLVPQARNLWKQSRKSELLDEIYRKAEIKATDPYSDVAFATKLRSEFKNLATNKNKLRGFSAEEIKAIEDAAKGGKIENALRAFGKSQEGAVLKGENVAAMSIPALIGLKIAGPAGAIIGANVVPASRAISRRVAGTLGKQNLQNVIDTIKTGGNPYSGIKLMQGSTAPLNAAGLLAPYMTNPEDYKSLL